VNGRSVLPCFNPAVPDSGEKKKETKQCHLVGFAFLQLSPQNNAEEKVTLEGPKLAGSLQPGPARLPAGFAALG